jgi:hypothetical protein
MQNWLKFYLIFLFTISFSMLSWAQESKKNNWKIGGFIDLYYGFDFNQPEAKKRLPFLYNHTRHDQLIINLALIQVAYESKRFRGKLGLQQGTYAQDNYAVEPRALRWINEANIGIGLDQEQKLWLDVGVLPSHIGFESAISCENPTLGRSLIAENSPYFLTGAKLGWQKDDRWYFSVWLANGWQIIQGVAGNSLPSFGTQVNFSPNDRLTLNWSTLTGNNYPDELRRMRYFSNQYLKYQISEKWKLVAGIDLGWEQMAKNSTKMNFWSGASLISTYTFDENWKTSLRAEYYRDRKGLIAISQNAEGLLASGYSINLDRKIGENFILRIESRYLISPSEQFFKKSKPTSSNYFMLASISYRLK